ncbi:hypothetical protein [Streptomyces sp. NPDC054901]
MNASEGIPSAETPKEVLSETSSENTLLQRHALQDSLREQPGASTDTSDRDLKRSLRAR